MNDLIIIGGGGHCHSCIDVIELTKKFNIVGIIDEKKQVGSKILGYEVLGNDSKLDDLVKNYKNFFIAVGQIKTAAIRKKIFAQLKKQGAHFPSIISPLAHVSKHAEIGEGTIIMHHALVNANAKIGSNCIINTKSLIEHDATIGDHCHISTAAVVNGSCRVDDCSFVGSNATLKQSIVVSEGFIVPYGEKYE